MNKKINQLNSETITPNLETIPDGATLPVSAAPKPSGVLQSIESYCLNHSIDFCYSACNLFDFSVEIENRIIYFKMWPNVTKRLPTSISEFRDRCARAKNKIHIVCFNIADVICQIENIGKVLF